MSMFRSGGPERREALVLCAIVVVALAATQFLHASPVVVFAGAATALAAVAWALSYAVEQLAARVGVGIAALLTATAGNVPEALVVWQSLRTGQSDVARLSLLGSVLSNALLLTGLAIFVASLVAPDRTARFSRSAARHVALCGVAAGVVCLAILVRGSWDAPTLSVVGSVVLLTTYAWWLRSDVGRAAAEPQRDPPRLPLGVAIALLVAASVGGVWASDPLVSSLRQAMDAFGLTTAFGAVVVIAVAGNFTEHATAIWLAIRGEAKLAVGVAVGSALQVMAGVWPLLALATHGRLTFELAPVWIFVLLAAQVVLALALRGGAARGRRGASLVVAWLAVAAIAATGDSWLGS
jgi:Ca2+:H+ antiporter